LRPAPVTIATWSLSFIFAFLPGLQFHGKHLTLLHK
jgi:hypothetical protein